MKIVDSIPFAAELLSPTHSEVFRREGVVAGEGDVALGPDWALTLHETGDLPQVAADHLKHFLSQSLGIELGCCGTDRRVVLAIDPSLDPSPEAHRLLVTKDTVEVTGAGAPGVLQGVFRLEARMREKGAAVLQTGEELRRPLFKHRIHRSPLSPFYVDELTGERGDPFNAEWISPGMAYPAYAEEDAGPDVFYHDNILMRLAEHGFNGIWVRGSFRHFAKVSVFPEFGKDSDRILSRLRSLARRAARFGINVFLYLNEPLGIADDDEFFRNHPQCRGAASTYKPMVNLCTSTPEIKTYLRESANYIFTQVPELAGCAMITASEYPSHCWCRTGIDPENPERCFGEVQVCEARSRDHRVELELGHVGAGPPGGCAGGAARGHHRHGRLLARRTRRGLRHPLHQRRVQHQGGRPQPALPGRRSLRPGTGAPGLCAHPDRHDPREPGHPVPAGANEDRPARDGRRRHDDLLELRQHDLPGNRGRGRVQLVAAAFCFRRDARHRRA